MPAPLTSIEGVAHVETISGPDADHERPPELLVEVPHGADERHHYDALQARLSSALPKDLHYFFHTNTDVGAWNYGRLVAEEVVRRRPKARALLVRCLIPRTFIDTNRELATKDQLASGGLTGAIAPYVDHPSDLKLLHELHAQYVALVESAYASVCGAGGMALTPHTYGPYVLPISAIDADIVRNLIRAHDADTLPSLKVRPEVDLLTDTKDGERLADPGLTEEIARGLTEAGFSVARNASYQLIPGSQTYRLSSLHLRRVFCLEVRRDLLVERYTPFEPMTLRNDAVERLARPIASAISDWFLRAHP